MRCAIFGRDEASPDFARVLAFAEVGRGKNTVAARGAALGKRLERVLAGSVIGREQVTNENPRTAFCARSVRNRFARSAYHRTTRRTRHQLAFLGSRRAFDENDMVMLRSAGSHVGLALANVQLYDLERLRRARAESLERVVRCCATHKRSEEVLLVFAVTVSREVRLTCAAYEPEGSTAIRRALRTVESAREGVLERIDLARALPVLSAGTSRWVPRSRRRSAAPFRRQRWRTSLRSASTATYGGW